MKRSYTLPEIVRFLENEITRLGEPIPQQLATTIQMSKHLMDWTQIKELFCRFDSTASEQNRLQLKAVKSFESVSEISDGRSTGMMKACSHGGKPGHDSSRCWRNSH